MPVVNTKGAASSQGFGEFAKSGAAAYIEDVFSTYLYTGTGAAQTITNGIDLSTKGGLAWIKSRSSATQNHNLFDTNQGATKLLHSDLNDAGTTDANSLTAFNTTGFTLGSGNTAGSQVNTSAGNYVSWTFRKQPKFFDAVTYTGTGANRTIAHNLGSVPGCIIIKRTDLASSWTVYHKDIGTSFQLYLAATSAKDAAGPTVWQNTAPTSTVFSLGSFGGVNASGGTYVAYIFASNAGGFGLAGTDNVITCGSYTGTGAAGNVVTLGYEPQWLLIKKSSAIDDWILFDNMRGLSVDGNDYTLNPNGTTSDIGGNKVDPTATGFILSTPSGSVNDAAATYIYIAIRRGPMKTPTTGTSVFSPISTTAATGTAITTGFSVDMQIGGKNTIAGAEKNWVTDRLRGVSTTATESGALLLTMDTAAENTISAPTLSWSNTGFSVISNNGGANQSYWNFKRAPGFFDEVCYTGTAGNLSVAHNLAVVPELIITKRRETTGNWWVWHSSFGTGTAPRLLLNSNAATSSQQWFSAISSTSFDLANAISVDVNASGGTYTNYLFATCSGVSKVFSYTGNGTSQTIACGFTGGARFVMIKRTNAVGDWYVWDTARGIIAGNDPHLSLNTTTADVTTDDSIDPDSTGFIVNQLTATNINVSAATYIGLAIA